MAYPHKWSPISYKSSAGQRKHIGQRPMLYRWTTPPTVDTRTVQTVARCRQSPCVHKPGIVKLLLLIYSFQLSLLSVQRTTTTSSQLRPLLSPTH